MSEVQDLCGRLGSDMVWIDQPEDDAVRHLRMKFLKAEHPVVSIRLRRDVLDFPHAWLKKRYGIAAMLNLGFTLDEASGALIAPAKLHSSAFVAVDIGHKPKRKGFLGNIRDTIFAHISFGTSRKESFPVDKACGIFARFHGLLEEAEDEDEAEAVKDKVLADEAKEARAQAKAEAKAQAEAKAFLEAEAKAQADADAAVKAKAWEEAKADARAEFAAKGE